MNKPKFLFSLIIAFYLCGVVNAAADSTTVKRMDGPRLYFEEEAFDFGAIEPGQIVDHVFHFQNVGLDTVYIKQVTSG